MTFRDDMEADLSTFFDEEGGFAEPATFVPVSGLSYSLSVIFDETYSSIDLNTQIEVMSSEPKCRFNASQIVGGKIAEGDSVVIRGTTYRIEEPMPDGIGCIIARLMV